MKKILTSLFLLLAMAMALPSQAYAANCSEEAFGITHSGFPSEFYNGVDYSVPLTLSGLASNGNYILEVKNSYDLGIPDSRAGDAISFRAEGRSATITLSDSDYFHNDRDRNNSDQDVSRYLELITPNGNKCRLAEFESKTEQYAYECSVDFRQDRGSTQNNTCFDSSQEIFVEITNFRYKSSLNSPNAGQPYNGTVHLEIDGGGLGGNDRDILITNGRSSRGDEGATIPVDTSPGDQFWVNVKFDSGSGFIDVCSNRVVISDSCEEDDLDYVEPPDIDSVSGGDVGFSKFDLCGQIPDGALANRCATECPDGIWTALGCIGTNPISMIKTLTTIGLNTAGGIALISILVSGFQFSTSKGDPKRTSEAKELLQSAIIGLLFVVLSVTILQFIGADILRIPGFGSS